MLISSLMLKVSESIHVMTTATGPAEAQPCAGNFIGHEVLQICDAAAEFLRHSLIAVGVL